MRCLFALMLLLASTLVILIPLRLCGFFQVAIVDNLSEMTTYIKSSSTLILSKSETELITLRKFI